MAQKRMFDRSIIENDYFMDLPIGAKALYFLLGMEADDEGFVSPKRILRLYGGSEDDIKILIAKNFLIKFDSGVVVITDWKTNNWLDKRRIKETRFVLEKSLIECNNNRYNIKDDVAKQLLSIGSVSIEENSIEENSIDKSIKPKKKPPKKILFKDFVKLTEDEHNKLIDMMGKSDCDKFIERINDYVGSTGKVYKSHYYAIRQWYHKEHPNIEIKKEVKPSKNSYVL